MGGIRIHEKIGDGSEGKIGDGAGNGEGKIGDGREGKNGDVFPVALSSLPKHPCCGVAHPGKILGRQGQSRHFAYHFFGVAFGREILLVPRATASFRGRFKIWLGSKFSLLQDSILCRMLQTHLRTFL